MDVRGLPLLTSPAVPGLDLWDIDKLASEQGAVKDAVTLLGEACALGHKVRRDCLSWWGVCLDGSLFFLDLGVDRRCHCL